MTNNDVRSNSIMVDFIRSFESLDEAVICYVANQLETPLFPATQIRNLFADVIAKDDAISAAWAFDILASAMDDDGEPNAASVILFNKGAV